ncbi:uncharacterized protein LOC105664526 [Ceratitis capitata]|uniref:uncharacterized protein LOC105664526 n=1 Tax=Ceratitis capitata TaxID=7213 RepID=UPI000618965D|nr:uncharacterized protein LOC105664526 [Ceratitis capitata]
MWLFKFTYDHTIILLILGFCSAVTGERLKDPKNKLKIANIVVTNFTCAHKLAHIVESVACSRAVHNNRTYLYGSLILRQPLERLDVNSLLDIYGPNGQRVNIFNIKTDGCAVLAAKRHDIYVVDNILKLMYATVNEAPVCPLKAHFNYTVTALDINKCKVPAFLPKAKFRAAVYFRLEGRQSASLVLDGYLTN